MLEKGKNNRNGRDIKCYNFKTVSPCGLSKEQALSLIKKMHLNVHLVFKITFSLLFAMTLLKTTKMVGVKRT